jgi:hypothetical protein
MKEQKCILCGKIKPISSFEWCKNRPNPKRKCKKCSNKERWINLKNNEAKHDKMLVNRRLSRIKNPERLKNNELKTNYMIDINIYKSMLKNQDNKCLICNNKFKNSRDTHIDHCHKTKKVRGLLCSRCNCGIGLLREDINILENAIKYIKHYEVKA